MSLDPITSLTAIRSELETGWKLFDDVYDALAPKQWSKKFGSTWTFAWQPYHLAFFDAMAAKYLAYGPDVPADDKMHLRTVGEINDWNGREFAKRGANHTFQNSLEEMRKSRDALRRHIDEMSDRDLERPAWIPLIFGWGTAGDLLKMVIVHNVAEYWKLWIRTGKRGPAPSPSAVRLRLAFVMNFMPASLNRELAAMRPFTVVWDFEGPGGGAWTLSVADGQCTVTEGGAPRPDLKIRMKPENFHKIVAKMTPPPLLLLTGQMKVKGLGALGTFGKLFPDPKPDQILEAVVPF